MYVSLTVRETAYAHTGPWYVLISDVFVFTHTTATHSHSATLLSCGPFNSETPHTVLNTPYCSLYAILFLNTPYC